MTQEHNGAVDHPRDPKDAETQVRSFASFPRRLICLVLDLLICAAFVGMLIEEFSSLFKWSLSDRRLLHVVAWCLYFWVFWSLPTRATVAQLLFRIEVVDERGEALGMGRSAARSMVLMLLILGVFCVSVAPNNGWMVALSVCSFAGFLLAAYTRHHQGLHDLIVGTRVLNRTPQPLRPVGEPTQAAANAPPRLSRWISNIGNTVIVVGLFIALHTAFSVNHDMDLRQRVTYAYGETRALRGAIEAFYESGGSLPVDSQTLGAGARTAYKDGGYYELGSNGSVRIQFEIKPELSSGVIVLRPSVTDGIINWTCDVEGSIAPQFLPSTCR